MLLPGRAPRRTRMRRMLRLIGIGLLGLLVLALVAALVLWRYATSQLERIDPPALGERTSPDPVPGTLNVLVVGSDSREGLSPQELEILGTEAVGGDRTDTIMLVQVSPVRQQAVVLSFPRDLVVDIPGHGSGKINSVYGEGGADLLIRTVQQYTGVTVDHYVQVNLAGFLRLARAVGGVEVCLEQPLEDVGPGGQNFTGLDLPAGCQVLDAVAAARFVRARHVADDQFGRDDFGRIARQQYFIRQAMRKVTSAGTLLNPLRVKRLIDVVARSVVTDRGLGVGEMVRLANALEGLEPADLETRTIPSYAKGGFVYAYPEQAETLFQALREGRPLPEVGIDPPAELLPQQVTVAVLNGVGTEGLAAEVAELLRSGGFRIGEVTNADSFDVAVTTIGYGPGERARAELVAALVPGELIELEQAPAGADVVLTIGADWQAP